MNNNILYISENYYPENTPLSQRSYGMCKRLAEHGHTVTVITRSLENSDGVSRRGLHREQYIDGVRVLYVPTLFRNSQSKSIFIKLLHSISFMVSSYLYCVLRGHFDIIIASSPQLFSALSGLLSAMTRRKKFILDVRDLWPDSLITTDAQIPGLAFKCLRKIECFLYKHATLITVVTKRIKEILEQRGINGKKIRVITNGYNTLDKASPLPPLKKESSLTIGYIGIMAYYQDLKMLLRVAQKTQDLGMDITYLFVGDGQEKSDLEAYAKNHSLSNVTFYPKATSIEVQRYWDSIDVSLTHHRKNFIADTALPAKMFDSLKHDVPILCGCGQSGFDFIDHYGVGFNFTQDSSENLFKVITNIYSHRNIVEACVSNIKKMKHKYDRSYIADKLEKIVNDVIQGHAP